MVFNVPNEYLDLVDIYSVENLADDLLPKYDFIVKNSDFDWILIVDNDELLLLNNNFKNIKDYVEKKIAINNNINIFYFRWGMIEKYDIKDNNYLQDIFKTYKVHLNGHIKTMVKRSELKSIWNSHVCSLHKDFVIYFENKISDSNSALISPSKETYEEAVLLHLHTRSIHNIIIKSFKTIFGGKFIKEKNEFINFINKLDTTCEIVNTIEVFKNYIGGKAILPFYHVNVNNINKNKYSVLNYTYKVIDIDLEKEIINDILNENNINKDKYYYFINKLNNEINNTMYNKFYEI
jgi:hypothetical protein